jgi:hypothetical protein
MPKEDRPFRPPSGNTEEDNRRAFVRLNERIDYIVFMLDHIEQILRDNSLWVDP